MAKPELALELLSHLRSTTLDKLSGLEMGLHTSGYHQASTEVSNARSAIEKALDTCIVNIHEQSQ